MKRLSALASIFALFMMLTACATVTPLGRAAKIGDIKKVETLLQQGEDVNEVMTPGLSPLHEAVFNNAPLEIIGLLIDRGADVNMKSCGDGWATECNCGTPLHIAACKGNADMVNLLLDRGAEIDSIDTWGYTPLGQAAAAGRTAIVKLLIEKGADADVAKGFLISKGDTNAAQVIALAEKYAPKTRAQIPAEKGSEPVRSDIDELPASKIRPNKNSCAIVIGIEQYRQKLPRADFAVKDARLVENYLARAMGFPEENIALLTNEHAALGDFVKYFEKWLPNNVEKGSTVFVYFSGHGAPDPKTGGAYLVPYDGDPTFIAQTGYPLKRMYAALEKLPAKEIVVALDSCFSGAGGRSVIAKGARPLVMNLENNTPTSRNMTVMSASSGSQVSATYTEKGHGLFTYFLLEGIKNEDVVNSDGTLKVDDLFAYVKPRVERIARKQYNNEQTPQLMGSK